MLLPFQGCTGGNEEEENNGEPPPSSHCQRDEHNSAEEAVDLAMGESANGYVCPVGDRDWYRFDIPADNRIMTVSLKMSSPLSAVEPTYQVWSTDAAGAPQALVASPAGTAIGAHLEFVDCVEPGNHLIVVKDQWDNSQDIRHSYELLVTAMQDSDPNEPNDNREQATPIQAGVSVQGNMACRGDQDWFVIDVPAGNLMHLTLTSDVAAYEPKVAVYSQNDALLFEESNLSGSVSPTHIERLVQLQGAGHYYLVVSDDDGKDADPSVDYSLLVELVQDLDPNEPNDTPEDATPLASGPVACGSEWTPYMETWGTIGARGDHDWFRLDLEGCENGLIEAIMTFNTGDMDWTQRWEFATRMQANLTLVRPHEDSPCEQASDCNRLNIDCSENLDCAGYFEACMPDQKCSGAAACLPQGICGANMVGRRYECSPLLPECHASSGQPPPPNRAQISAPIFGDSVLFLRASDFQSDGADPETPYTLQVRVRTNPDPNEPSNLFTNQTQNPIPVRRHQGFAQPVPVLDCTGEDPQCCDSGSWIEGRISYENDMDWYQYEHPCPGEDCTLRFHYRTDQGPVDFVMNIYRDASLWFSAFENEQRTMQPARSGILGGLEPGDTCFYASQQHTGDPYSYYVVVRDLFQLYSDGMTVRPDSRDWSPNQVYSFCIEKISNQCEEPVCHLYEDGCGQP